MSDLRRLHEALAAEGGTLAETLVELEQLPQSTLPSDGAPALAASGPRAVARPADYELLLEMILEGSLLHYRTPRVLSTSDADLRLLLGDQLYALGLARLAELGDLTAVAELADVISLVAKAEAAEQPIVADAIWRAGAVAIGWGPSPLHREAKALARRDLPASLTPLSAAAESGCKAGRSPINGEDFQASR